MITTTDGSNYEIIQERAKEERTPVEIEIYEKGEVVDDMLAEIRTRGCSSLENKKNSLDLKIVKDDGDKKREKIFDMADTSRWVLYAPYVDKTMLRNVLGFELAREMGLTAPPTKFVEVYLNSQYLGVYVLTPKVSQQLDCSDHDPFIEGACIPNRGKTSEGGYMFKRDGVPTEDDLFFETAISEIPFIFMAPDGEDPEEAAAVKQFVDDAEHALCHRGFQFAYDEYIDVNSFANFFLLRELFGDMDGFRRSMHFYVSQDNKLTVGPVWDLDGGSGGVRITVPPVPLFAVDEIFGEWHEPDYKWIITFKYGLFDKILDNFGGILPAKLKAGLQKLRDERPLPLIRRMLQDPVFVEKVKERWAEVRSDLLGWDSFETREHMCDRFPYQSRFWDKILDYAGVLTNGCYLEGMMHNDPLSFVMELDYIDGDCPMLRNYTRWDQLGKESPTNDSKDSGQYFWDEAKGYEICPSYKREYRVGYTDILVDWHNWVYMRAAWMDEHINELGELFPIGDECVLAP
jgi:hypothetical protein